MFYSKDSDNDNSSLIILTIFFSIFLICVVSVFVFYRIKSLSGKDENNKNNVEIKEENTDNINLENKPLEVIISKLEDSNFIELMMSKNNINEINNSELLYYLIQVTESQSQFGKIDNVPFNIINDIHKDSLFNNIVFNHDNIILNNQLLWVYNKESNIYIKNNIDKELIVFPLVIILDNIVLLENNQYKISYKYIFKNLSDNNIYGSYNDSINKVNAIYIDTTNNSEVLIQELKKNYDNIKNKLSIYNYIVEVNDNNYILKEFNVNKNS